MTSEITMTILDAPDLLRSKGYIQDGEYFIRSPFYCGILEYALQDMFQRFPKEFPDFPKISMKKVKEKLNKVGRRLDVYPPDPNTKSLELGVDLMLKLPPGEILLGSEGAKRISTFIDSCFYPIFEYRKEVLKKAHPKFASLPCEIYDCGQRVHAVHERGILMGPSVTYPIEIQPRKMVKWAMQFKCLVIQLEDTDYAWIIPWRGRPQVWCIKLPITGTAGSVPDGLMYRAKPHPVVTIKRIVP